MDWGQNSSFLWRFKNFKSWCWCLYWAVIGSTAGVITRKTGVMTTTKTLIALCQSCKVPCDNYKQAASQEAAVLTHRVYCIKSDLKNASGKKCQNANHWNAFSILHYTNKKMFGFLLQVIKGQYPYISSPNDEKLFSIRLWYILVLTWLCQWKFWKCLNS